MLKRKVNRLNVKGAIVKNIPPMLKPIALLALPLLIITATEVGTKTGTQAKQKEKTIIVREKEIVHTTTEKVVPESSTTIEGTLETTTAPSSPISSTDEMSSHSSTSTESKEVSSTSSTSSSSLSSSTNTSSESTSESTPESSSASTTTETKEGNLNANHS